MDVKEKDFYSGNRFQYILELSDKIKQFLAICFFFERYRLYQEKCLWAGLSMRGHVIKVYFSKTRMYLLWDSQYALK